MLEHKAKTCARLECNNPAKKRANAKYCSDKCQWTDYNFKRKKEDIVIFECIKELKSQDKLLCEYFYKDSYPDNTIPVQVLLNDGFKPNIIYSLSIDPTDKTCYYELFRYGYFYSDDHSEITIIDLS